MLSGDCNVCINGKMPSYSATCVECGLSRKNYKPITNADRIRSADAEIEMVDIILKLVKKIPEGENKRRTLYQLLMQEAENG